MGCSFKGLVHVELSLTYNTRTNFVNQFLGITTTSTPRTFSVTREQLLLRKQDPLPVRITITFISKDGVKQSRVFHKLAGKPHYRWENVVEFMIR